MRVARTGIENTRITDTRITNTGITNIWIATIWIGMASLMMTAGSAAGGPIVPDNGSGTADLPLHVPYEAASQMIILGGLPSGSSITIDAVLTAPPTTAEQAGGSLGGTQSAAAGSGFTWTMQGTGVLAGYSRVLFFPLAGGVASFAAAPPDSGFEVDAASRTSGAPVQTFNTDMFRMFGQITGDPDFDLLRITAGTDFGLPSPGNTVLTAAGGGWDVNSIFDLTYRIDFVGAPSGPFGGLSGSTTGTVRLTAVPEPSSIVLLGFGGLLLAGCRRVTFA